MSKSNIVNINDHRKAVEVPTVEDRAENMVHNIKVDLEFLGIDPSLHEDQILDIYESMAEIFEHHYGEVE